MLEEHLIVSPSTEKELRKQSDVTKSVALIWSVTAIYFEQFGVCWDLIKIIDPVTMELIWEINDSKRFIVQLEGRNNILIYITIVISHCRIPHTD